MLTLDQFLAKAKNFKVRTLYGAEYQQHYHFHPDPKIVGKKTEMHYKPELKNENPALKEKQEMLMPEGLRK